MLVNSFNNFLKEFCEKLQIMIPNNDSIKLINNAYHVGLLTNKEIYIQHFYNHVNEFHQDIINKNEKIFLENDFSMIPNVAGYQHHINEMKEIWESNLKNSHKDIIWDYLKVLSTLSVRHYSTK